MKKATLTAFHLRRFKNYTEQKSTMKINWSRQGFQHNTRTKGKNIKQKQNKNFNQINWILSLTIIGSSFNYWKKEKIIKNVQILLCRNKTEKNDSKINIRYELIKLFPINKETRI